MQADSSSARSSSAKSAPRGRTTIHGVGGRFALTLLFAMPVLLFSRESMAMFNYNLFSAVRGVVVSNGQPVSGATIERSYEWTWKESKGKDQTTTNAKGEFQLPEVSGSALFGWLPHQAMVRQTIQIKHGGKVYDAWLYTKSNYKPNGELNGRPIVLHCSLEAPVQRKESGVPNRFVNGICELR